MTTKEYKNLYKKELASTPRGYSRGTGGGTVGPSESQIQSAILDKLGYLKGGFFWRENSGQFALESKGKKRFFRAGVKGIADIMGVYKGYPVAIEVKKPTTKKNVSIHQEAFLQRYRDCGGIAIVCCDPEEVVKLIEEQM